MKSHKLCQSLKFTHLIFRLKIGKICPHTDEKRWYFWHVYCNIRFFCVLKHNTTFICTNMSWVYNVDSNKYFAQIYFWIMSFFVKGFVNLPKLLLTIKLLFFFHSVDLLYILYLGTFDLFVNLYAGKLFVQLIKHWKK